MGGSVHKAVVITASITSASVATSNRGLDHTDLSEFDSETETGNSPSTLKKIAYVVGGLLFGGAVFTLGSYFMTGKQQEKETDPAPEKTSSSTLADLPTPANVIGGVGTAGVVLGGAYKAYKSYKNRSKNTQQASKNTKQGNVVRTEPSSAKRMTKKIVREPRTATGLSKTAWIAIFCVVLAVVILACFYFCASETEADQ